MDSESSHQLAFRILNKAVRKPMTLGSGPGPRPGYGMSRPRSGRNAWRM